MSTWPPMRGVVLDLDGVLYRGDAPVSGADDLMAGLTAAGIGVVALTNHAGRTPDEVSAKLAGLGVRMAADAVITSAFLAGAYLARRGTGSVRVIGTPSLERAVLEVGVQVDPNSDEAVVVGYAPEATFADLAGAARAVHAGAHFVATNDDGAVPAGSSIWPDAGATVAFVAAASAHAPVVVGKPATGAFEEGLRRLGLRASEIAVVGDTLATDIVGGNAIGCRTLWLHEGGAGAMNAASRPTWTARDLYEVRETLLAAAGGGVQRGP